MPHDNAARRSNTQMPPKHRQSRLYLGHVQEHPWMIRLHRGTNTLGERERRLILGFEPEMITAC